MSCPAHSNQAGRGRRLLLGALAVVVLVWLMADAMGRLAGHSAATWMTGLEVLAAMALTIGAAVLMWQVRAENAVRTAAGRGHATLHASAFRVADGGSGLPAQPAGQDAERTSGEQRVYDGGAFPSRRGR